MEQNGFLRVRRMYFCINCARLSTALYRANPCYFSTNGSVACASSQMIERYMLQALRTFCQ